jgi:hypothetical protein
MSSPPLLWEREDHLTLEPLPEEVRGIRPTQTPSKAPGMASTIRQPRDKLARNDFSTLDPADRFLGRGA